MFQKLQEGQCSEGFLGQFAYLSPYKNSFIMKNNKTVFINNNGKRDVLKCKQKSVK